MAVWQHQSQIARGSAPQGGSDDGAAQALRGRATARFQITQPLYQHAAAEQVGQSGDGLAVGHRVVKGFGEILAHQQGKVGVIGFAVGVGVAVDRHHAARIFQRHLAVGTDTKGAHQIVKGLGIVKKLEFVEQIGDRCHHRRRQLDPHADVDRVARE